MLEMQTELYTKCQKIKERRKIMKKYQRLQGNKWHNVKNSFRLLYTHKSDKGNIKGIYTDGKTKISQQRNNDEKTDYVQCIKGSDSNVKD